MVTRRVLAPLYSDCYDTFLFKSIWYLRQPREHIVHSIRFTPLQEGVCVILTGWTCIFHSQHLILSVLETDPGEGS